VATRYALVRLVVREREQTYIGAAASAAFRTVPFGSGTRAITIAGVGDCRDDDGPPFQSRA